MMKLSDYVFEFIKNLGVKTVFLLPGGGCMHLVDSLGKQEGLNYTCCLHEQAAAIAADAYSQFTNNIGVVLVTTGPGGTNAITGVAGSWIDSIPMLIISGQVKSQDMIGESGLRQKGVQEIDIVPIVKHITKYAVTITEPESIRYHLEKAVYLAKSGRQGPVWIDIPLDIQSAKVEENTLEGFHKNENEGYANETVQKQVHELLAFLERSQRPVLLAGNGIRLAKAEEEFQELIRLLKIPVLTTWKVMDFLPENDPLFFGRPGSIGQRAANFIQQNSDLFISIGARLDLAQIGYSYENFAPKAMKVVVDVDAAELKKMRFESFFPIESDARVFLRELVSQLKGKMAEFNKESFGSPEWFAKCKEWNEKYPVVLPEYRLKKDYVSTYVLIDVLSHELSENDIIVPGSSGACSEITMQAFKVKGGQRILNSPGLGAMGFGIPASIGACIASGRRRTICINGDGGFQLNIQELETVAREKLPIKFFVLNNTGYGSIRNTQNNYFQGRFVCSDPSSGLTLPDIVKIARAYGINAVRIRNNKELEGSIVDILKSDGPIICDVLIDTTEPTMPRMKSEVRSDGIIVSKPLEDLWPFLDRKTFKAEMIFPPYVKKADAKNDDDDNKRNF